MSDQENFLARWSRRKLEPADKQVPADSPPDGSMPPASKAATSEFDLSKLPSLDSIGAGTDITAFLQAGVPSALKHAALRRAWTTDPAIRDYIGPNENFWEGVGGIDNVPGFGALDPSVDVKKLVAQIFGEAEPRPRADDVAPADANVPAAGTTESSPAESKKQLAQNANPLLQRDENVAPHQDDPPQDAAAVKPRRHGGAVPR